MFPGSVTQLSIRATGLRNPGNLFPVCYWKRTNITFIFMLYCMSLFWIYILRNADVWPANISFNLCWWWILPVNHYNDVNMSAMASQITSLTIVYWTVYSGADQRKLQSSASLAFVRGIHRGAVNSPHKWPVTRKMFPFDDVIMWQRLVLTFCQMCYEKNAAF